MAGRTTYVWRDGRLLDKRLAPRPVVQRSGLPAPMIISDALGEVWNPVNGQVYDSKSAYYRAVKDAGCQIVGNDSSFREPAPPPFEAEGVEQSLSQAIDQLTAA
jgi:hypothetical protein